MTGNYDSNSKCLICATPISNLLEDQRSEKLIGKHLKIIFLLRKVLNISSDKLVQFLKCCPDIDEWISVCENCEALVNQCRELYYELLKVSRNFESGKQMVIKIVKESRRSSSNFKDDDDKENEGILDIFNEVREDVNKSKC